MLERDDKLAALLGVAVWIQAMGFVAAARFPTSLNSYLFIRWGVPDETVSLLDAGLQVFFLICGILTLVRPSLFALGGMAFVILLNSFATAINGGSFEAPFSVVATAARWMMPIALALFVVLRREKASEWVLRIALAATFVAHGMEALYQNPHFVDFILSGSRNLLDVTMAEGTARGLLTAIGVVDVLLAGAIVVARSRLAAGYMAFWGLVTAGSRIVYLGPEYGIPEFLLRTANWAVPLTLLGLWSIREAAQTAAYAKFEEYLADHANNNFSS